MSLFKYGYFSLHSGYKTNFKIDCDALTDVDIDALALLALSMLPEFGSVEGIPTGGLRLAKELELYKTKGLILLVDDVFTTGMSMKKQRNNRPDVRGLVIFARGPVPSWITPIFQSHILV